MRRLALAVALSAAMAGCARQERPAASAVVAASTPASPAASSPPTVRDVAREKDILAANPPVPAPPYIGTVRAGNQRPLGPAAAPFAAYIEAMHTRIHAEYGDKELGRIDALPATHPLNRIDLRSVVELALDGASGVIADLVMVRSSGDAAFDALVVDVMRHAAPFGAAPAAIQSPDGKVYVHWLVARDELYACSPRGARPYLLRTDVASP